MFIGCILIASSVVEGVELEEAPKLDLAVRH
jgi:hypothetical protein